MMYDVFLWILTDHKSKNDKQSWRIVSGKPNASYYAA